MSKTKVKTVRAGAERNIQRQISTIKMHAVTLIATSGATDASGNPRMSPALPCSAAAQVNAAVSNMGAKSNGMIPITMQQPESTIIGTVIARPDSVAWAALSPRAAPKNTMP